MDELDLSIPKIGIDDEEYPKYAQQTADWETYVYAFNGRRFKLNPDYVLRDEITQMLIESEVYVREEKYGEQEDK